MYPTWFYRQWFYRQRRDMGLAEIVLAQGGGGGVMGNVVLTGAFIGLSLIHI